MWLRDPQVLDMESKQLKRVHKKSALLRHFLIFPSKIDTYRKKMMATRHRGLKIRILYLSVSHNERIRSVFDVVLFGPGKGATIERRGNSGPW